MLEYDTGYGKMRIYPATEYRLRRMSKSKFMQYAIAEKENTGSLSLAVYLLMKEYDLVDTFDKKYSFMKKYKFVFRIINYLRKFFR